MKIIKVFGAVAVAVVLAAVLLGCGSKTDSANTSTQEYTVKKGNISLDITAAGNLALSQTQDCTVDIFYPAGTKATIGNVLVQDGDSVTAGEVLVTLDKDEWNEQLTNLQDSLTSAQRNVISKTTAVTDAERQLATLQRAVTTAESNVAKAQHQVDAKVLAVTAAQLNVTSANNTLNQITPVKNANDELNQLNDTLDFVNYVLSGVNTGALTVSNLSYYLGLKDQLLGITSPPGEITVAQQDLNQTLAGNNLSVTTDVNLLIAQKQYALQQAQLALEDAQTAVTDAQTAVDAAKQSVDDANYAVTKQQQALANARLDLVDANSTLADTQSKLTDAQSKSPEIKAPFDGFITAVNVQGGDEVLNGTVAVTVADPTKFEMEVLVSEMDIMKVSLDGDATVTLNAITGLRLPAKITYISPTATISSGVVNYDVKVEVDPQAVARLQQAGQAGTSGNTTTSRPAFSGNFTNGQGGASANMTADQVAQALQRAVESGRITQEQADAMAQQAQQGGGNFVFRSSGSGAAAAGQLPSTSQNVQLKEGLTGTVDLIVAQTNNVLVVPNGAITQSGGQSTVEVVTGTNTTEKRVVQTGLSDWQNTEITSGLTEGEKIIVPKNAAVATSTSSNRNGGPAPGPIFFGR